MPVLRHTPGGVAHLSPSTRRTSRRSLVLFGVVGVSVVSLALAVISAVVLFVLALAEGSSQARTLGN